MSPLSSPPPHPPPWLSSFLSSPHSSLLLQTAARGKSPNTFSRPCSPVALVPYPPLQHLAPPVFQLASGPINPCLAVLMSSCSSGDGVGVSESERERARVRTLRAKRSCRKSPISATQRVCTPPPYGPAWSAGSFLILSSSPCRISASPHPQGGISRLEAPRGQERWPGVLHTTP